MLFQKCAYEVAAFSVVHVEFHVLLAPVQNLDEYPFPVRRPCHIGQVLVVAVVVGLNIHRSEGCKVEDAEPYILRRHPCHRIFDFIQASCPCGDVEQGKRAYEGLVLTVECQFPAVRRPENPFRDAEFVPACELSVCDVFIAADGYRQAVPVAVAYVEAFAERICVSPAGARRDILCSGWESGHDAAAIAPCSPCRPGPGYFSLDCSCRRLNGEQRVTGSIIKGIPVF